ncbi:MAG: sigma-70 family RNA polymerase sigma factor [Verrucomicrobiota bacterium]
MNAPDPELFVSLLARHERMLAAYVMTLVPHAADADDILQDAKVVMWRNFGQFRPGTNFGAWARKVAFHQVLSHRKRKQRDRLQFSDEFLETVAQEMENSAEHLEQHQRALNDCVAKLPPDHREVLQLRYHEGLSIDALAERLNRTVAALYRQLSRVRRNLHDCVTRTFKRSPSYGTD